ncbi:tyrosine-type recombinase/integrase [Candidatus Macondimonas diazotrophica]|jgi:integrase/recombinase XerD|uniref:Site-specific integrase n=1 Tax=Candidatus Macondimonas diazotrophica TaxID=2305248 RepID=A0A4Z0F5V5_9GAMM|nr:site-specific integrase [Candidatus Macondimonas diazotrophica]TFZ81623.1 site-specific integrase [Candidatus Macondimonas diazotrophica]
MSPHIKRKAKRLTPDQIRFCFSQARQTRTPERDVVILHLSFGLGLRACEIAGLEWDRHVFDAEGKMTGKVWVSGDIAKNGRERTLSLPKPIVEALVELHAAQQGQSSFVVHSPKPNKDGLSPNTMVQWFRRFYRDCGFSGVSSHSGRRTLATKKAETVHQYGGTLRDVQLMLGHACLSTTEEYIDETPASKAMTMDLEYA